MPCWKNARPASAALSLLLLAACGQPADQPSAAAPPASAPPPAERSAAAPAPAVLRWSHEDRALVLREDDDEVLRIACVAGPGLAVQAQAFHHVDSEERMSVGAGNTVVALVATADADGQVKGEGPVDADLLRAIGEGRKIAVNYGYQNAGPYNGPPADVAAAFVQGCG